MHLCMYSNFPTKLWSCFLLANILVHHNLNICCISFNFFFFFFFWGGGGGGGIYISPSFALIWMAKQVITELVGSILVGLTGRPT